MLSGFYTRVFLPWELEGMMSWGKLGKEEVTRETGPEAGTDHRAGVGKEEVQAEI